MADEITQLQAQLAAANSTVTPDEREFVLQLLREARINGILEIQYKALTLRISPAAADAAQQKTYFAQVGGIAVPKGWAEPIPRAR